jgi:hypothetical protein
VTVFFRHYRGARISRIGMNPQRKALTADDDRVQTPLKGVHGYDAPIHILRDSATFVS